MSRSKATWGDAAKASAEREAAEASEAPKKREQTRLPLSSASDEVKVSVKIELHHPMTDEEWREQSEILAHDRVERAARLILGRDALAVHRRIVERRRHSFEDVIPHVVHPRRERECLAAEQSRAGGTMHADLDDGGRAHPAH